MASQTQDVPGLTVSAVARRMGVAPATLRTWDRRYGIGPSAHSAGSHRRYSAADVARLEHMRRLVNAGVAPVDAARAARDLEVDESTLGPLTARTPLTPLPEDELPDPGRSGGGQVVALPGAAPAARGLARAAQQLDTRACHELVAESLAQRGAVWTWDALVRPVLAGIGKRWSDTGTGVEVEHALSAAAQDAFGARVRASPPPTNTRPVLLACVPGEQHSLVLWVLAAALAERRIAARVLGADLPSAALADAVRRIGPGVIFLWSQIPGAATTSMLDCLPDQRPAATVLVGGAGWGTATVTLPPGVSRVTDLTDTVGRIAHAVAG
jgi:MerR family transcriptional regulator, light-induced transcriptional regulator